MFEQLDQIKDCCFHSCVDKEELANFSKIYLKPSKGKTTIMRYRVTRPQTLPFSVRIFLLKTGDFKAELGLIFEAQRELGLQTLEAEMRIPSVVGSVTCESDRKDGWVFETSPTERTASLRLTKLPTHTICEFRLKISLDENLTEKQI